MHFFVLFANFVFAFGLVFYSMTRLNKYVQPFLGGLLFLLFSGCQPLTQTDTRFFYFGTVIEIRVYSEHDPQPILHNIERQFADWHRRFHAWQPSELTALNAALQRGEQVQPAADLAELIKRSQALADASDHLFNPALGKRIAQWGFARDNMNSAMSAPAMIDSKRLPTMRDLQWQHDRLRSTHPDLQLDLGGIAKGYAMNTIMQQLRAAGIQHAMINIGGDIGVLGQTPTRAWQIAIQDPEQPNNALAMLTLHDGDMAFTSGTYAREHDSDQGRVHHIIDPRTGNPSQGNIAVTLVGRDGMLLQAACKVLLIVGDEWPHWSKNLGVNEAFVITGNGAQQFSESITPRLQFISRD